MATPKQNLLDYLKKDPDMNMAVLNTLINTAIDADVEEITCNAVPMRQSQTLEPATGKIFNKVVVAAATPVILSFVKATDATATEVINPVALLTTENTVEPTTTETLSYYTDAAKSTAFIFESPINANTVVYYDVAPAVIGE